MATYIWKTNKKLGFSKPVESVDESKWKMQPPCISFSGILLSVWINISKGLGNKTKNLNILSMYKEKFLELYSLVFQLVNTTNFLNLCKI